MTQNLTINFDRLYEMAVAHKSGDSRIVDALLSQALPVPALKSIPDDRWLSAASKAIFSAGFNWTVVDNKWPAHEIAFAHFNPSEISAWPDEEMDRLLSDASIIRHGAKIRSVFRNAAFFQDLANEHGSAAAYFAESPQTEYFQLLAELKKRGERLGGTSVQYFLRSMGMPSIILSRDVVSALIRDGIVDKAPTSKTALKAVQIAFNDAMAASGKDLTQLSRILALSVG